MGAGLIVMIGLFFFGSSARAGVAVPITNPGFETVDGDGKPLGWAHTPYYPDTVFARDTTVFRSGASSGRMYHPGGDGGGTEYEQILSTPVSITPAPGDAMEFSVWYKSNAVGGLSMQLIQRDDSGSGTYWSCWDLIDAGMSWQELKCRTGLLNTSVTVEISLAYAPNSGSGTIWFDDVSASPIPGGVVEGHLLAAVSGEAVPYTYLSVSSSQCGGPTPTYQDSGYAGADGYYQFSGVPVGMQVYLRVGSNGSYLPQYWDGKDTCSAADPIVVASAGESVTADFNLVQGGTISGTVTDAGGVGLQGVQVTAYLSEYNWSGSGYTDDNGAYSIGGLGTGTFKVKFVDFNGTYVGEWYNDASSYSAGIAVAVVAGDETPDIDASLSVGGSISGTVTAGGIGVPNVDVAVYALMGWGGYSEVQSAYTDVDGAYKVGRLGTGSYKVQFADSSGTYITEWYNDAISVGAGTAVVVTVGNETPNIDASLSIGGSLSGKVTGVGGVGLSNVQVIVSAVSTACEVRNGPTPTWSGSTDADGEYIVGGLAAGTYKVQFDDMNGTYVSEWYNNKTSSSTGTAVPVTAGKTTTGINAALVVGGSLSGTVTGAGGVGIQNVYVNVNSSSGSGPDSQGGYAFTDANGAYAVGGLAAGSYKVEFNDIGGTYASEWYNNKTSYDTGTAVLVATGKNTTGINASLSVGGSISGVVTNAGGVGIQNVWVDVYTPSAYGYGYAGYSGSTDGNGSYTVGGMPTGMYKVRFYSSSSNYASEWYNDVSSLDDGTPVGVTAGSETTDIDASLAAGGSISGTVTDAGGVGIQGVQVTAYASSASGGIMYAAYASTDANGVYAVGGLHDGTYKVYFSRWVDMFYLGEWYNDVTSFTLGAAVEVAAGSETPGIDATLSETVLTINDGKEWTKSPAVTLTLPAYSNGSTQMCISNTPTCTAWAALVSTKKWTLLAGNGTKTVYAKFRDTCGNMTSLYTDTIDLDMTAPMNGTLAAEAGPGENALSWSGFSDALSGIDRYKVVFAIGAAPASCATGTLVYEGLDTTATHAGLSNLAYGYRVCAIDEAGNVSLGAFKIAKPLSDGKPPTGTVKINTLSKDPAWTKIAVVTLSLTATDNSALIQMCISNTASCTTWTPFAATKRWTLAAGNGKKTVNVWFRDTWGNGTPPESPYSDTIDLDMTAPMNGTLAVEAGPGENALSWSGFSDALSGIDRYKVVFAIGAAPASCATGTLVYEGLDTTATHAGLSNLAYGYRVCAIDEAGNMSLGAFKIAKPLSDGKPPTGTVKINTLSKDPAWTKVAVVTLSLTATDNSALIQMCISNTASCTTWTPFAATKRWTLAAGNGKKTVNVWFRDTWGNGTPPESPCSDTIDLDITAPMNGTLVVEPGPGENALSWSEFSDALSGIAGYKVVFAIGAAPASCATGTLVPGYDGTGTSYKHTGLVNGKTYGYRVCAIDAAGNMSTGVAKTGKPTL